MVASEAILSPLTTWFGRAGGIWKRTLEKLHTRLLVPESEGVRFRGCSIRQLVTPASSSSDRFSIPGRLLPSQRPAVRCCHAALLSSDVKGWECGSFFRTIPFLGSTGMRDTVEKFFSFFSGFGFVDFIKKCNFAVRLLNPALPCLWQEHI